MITKTQKFKAIIRKGSKGNVLAVKATNWYQNELNKFEDGEEVIISLSNKKPKRSDQQNRYYWLYLGIISTETGEQDIEALHELFKGKFLGRKIKEVLGYNVLVKGSTTKLDKLEFCDYIRAIENLTGVQAPSVENYL